MGWRMTYCLVGSIGFVFSIATFLFIEEAPRGKFVEVVLIESPMIDDQEERPNAFMRRMNGLAEDFKKIWKLPVARNNYIVTFLRSFGGHATATFIPLFFQEKYPESATSYASINAIALSIIGSFSGIFFGIVADHYQKTTYLTKTMIIMGGSFLAPFFIMVTTGTDNFYVASAFWILKVFIHACFWGPTVTMIQDTTP